MVVSGTTLTVSWEPPPPEQRNGVIISYTLRCSDTVESFELVLNPISSIELYGLNPNIDYMCEIAASTAAGIGPFVITSNTTEGTRKFNSNIKHFTIYFAILLESETDLNILQWIPMGAVFGVDQQFLPSSDDGFVGPIDTVFPFGSSVQNEIFVSTTIDMQVLHSIP